MSEPVAAIGARRGSTGSATTSIAPSRSRRRSAGIERAVRDAPEEAEGLAEALLQLVAVERLLFEQAQDGDLEHGDSWVGWTDE